MNPETEQLLVELEESPALTWKDTCARIHDLHRKAKTSDERGLLLSMHIILMDAFREERRKDYNMLLMSEATDGQTFAPAMLLAATQREIAVGHIDEEHEMHKFSLASVHVAPPRQALWLSRLFGR
jgi:hypothetical protein